MYQSLYRKYRPKTFDEVIGQNVIVTTLKNSIKNNKISHAYLFTGPRGTGKTSVAKILAKTINCDNLIDMKPCNKCVSCTQILNKQSIDILEIDAASNNGVDEIRELNSKVNLVPSSGKYKVYIIDEVHMLTTGAFNALLKTLEEPPAHIIFILATTEPHKIPSTILSRCQRFDFKKLTLSEIQSKIFDVAKKEKIEITEDAILEIAKLSDGGMRDSLSMLDKVISYANDNIQIQDVHEVNGTITKEELGSFIEILILKQLEKILNKIDFYDENGKDFIKLTEEIIEFMKNLLLCKLVPNYLKDRNEMNSIYEKMIDIIDDKILLLYIKEFNEEINNLKNSNNPKLIFELLIIKLMSSERKNKEIIVTKEQEKKDEQQSVIKTIKKSEEETILLDDKIEKLKKIRVNNTLCAFDKKKIIEIKKQISNLSSLMLNQKYGEIYSIIIDGELKAFGNNIIIFVYQSVRISNEFNKKIFEIEECIKKYINFDYKVIATSQEEWNIIKNEFNNKKKIYEYIEEPLLTSKKENNNIEELFESIIEYN
ncbi:MAG: DNA polymerase III subunit gamma/tau [Bacilli bacterium]|nr:DNA polymerase III subunit gamma/tau [Bacilli bacterium]